MTPKITHRKTKHSVLAPLKELRKLRKEHPSWSALAKHLNVPKMTLSRCERTGKISKYYSNFIYRAAKDPYFLKKVNKSTLSPQEILIKLNHFKEWKGSWDKVAQSWGIPKKTIMRWRKTSRISPCYCKLLTVFLSEVPSNAQ